MNSFKSLLGKDYIKAKFAVLWIFVMLNYVYADIFTLMDPSVLQEMLGGTPNGVEITPAFLLMGAILMEIPIAMILLSLVLPYRANRWSNIFAGSVKTLAVAASTFVGTPSLYYLFFAIIEVLATLYIVWLAWTWKEAANNPI